MEQCGFTRTPFKAVVYYMGEVGFCQVEGDILIHRALTYSLEVLETLIWPLCDRALDENLSNEHLWFIAVSQELDLIYSQTEFIRENRPEVKGLNIGFGCCAIHRSATICIST